MTIEPPELTSLPTVRRNGEWLGWLIALIASIALIVSAGVGLTTASQVNDDLEARAEEHRALTAQLAGLANTVSQLTAATEEFREGHVCAAELAAVAAHTQAVAHAAVNDVVIEVAVQFQALMAGEGATPSSVAVRVKAARSAVQAAEVADARYRQGLTGC